MRIAFPPFVLFIDCMENVQCICQPLDAMSIANPRAHLWSRVWSAWEGGLEARKILAHATPADVEAGKTTW